LPALVTTAILAGLLSGCSGQKEPGRRVADRFMDLHYLVLDQSSALEITEGLAQEKIRRELDLIGNARADAEEFSRAKPRLTYRFEGVSDLEDGGRRYHYRLRIRGDAGLEFDRAVHLTLRRGDETWRVSNFIETEVDVGTEVETQGGS
jgi:hypothetical protein